MNRTLFSKTYPRILNLIPVVFILLIISGYVNAQSSGCFKMVASTRIDNKAIIPCGATKITLTFNYFYLTTGSLVKIYDGTDASGKPLHSGTGFTFGNPPSGPLEAYSGAIYVYFSASSSKSGTDSFEACWTSVLNTAKPIAKFEIPDTIYSYVKNTFVNTSKNLHNKTDYVWNIEPGYSEVGYYKDLNWMFYTNGTFDVGLTTTTCSGKDYYAKKVVVITPDYKVNLDLKAKKLQPYIGEADTLTGINFVTRKKPVSADRFRWEFVPDKVTYLNGTSPNSQIIQVKFHEKGKYKVSLKAWNSGDSADSYSEVVKKDYITVNEVPRPRVYLDIIAKNTKPIFGQADTLYAIDSIPGKLFKATRFRWEFSPSTITYLNGTSADMQTIQVKFNQKGKYTVSLKGWNSADSTATLNDTLKTDYITVIPIPRVSLDFVAKNEEPEVGKVDTLFAVDSKNNLIQADRFRWEFSPDKVSYENGTSSRSKTIQVKFKEEGNYTVTLFGWNSDDSAASFNNSVKINYIKVKPAVNPKVYLDFFASNLNPKVGNLDTIIAVDSMAGKPFKANRFKWKFSPDKVTYVNGTSSSDQTIQVKFNEKGNFTITLKGWNSADSAATFNSIFKTDYITAEEPTIAIRDILSSNNFVKIYPNPSSGPINISFNRDMAETLQIQVYSGTGKLMFEANGINSSSGIQTIDLSNKPAGLYTLRIRDNKRQINQKVSLKR